MLHRDQIRAGTSAGATCATEGSITVTQVLGLGAIPIPELGLPLFMHFCAYPSDRPA